MCASILTANGDENGIHSVGDIFSDETNPGRKKSFDIRKVMMAVVDQDQRPWSAGPACARPKLP